jgi:broad specificity phosphatase PhoE
VQITFVRHAESEANVTGRWQGHGDAKLSEEGRRQARALAERLSRERFDVVIASDLTRAADTARAVHTQVELDPRWREVDVGAWEGLTREEVLQRFPEQIAALQKGEVLPIGGGESWADLLQRVEAALGDLQRRLGADQKALVVTHGGVIHMLVSSLMQCLHRRPRPVGRVGNTAATTLGFGGDGCELVAFNDASHLGPMGAWARERLQEGDSVIALVGSEAVADRLAARIVARANGEVAELIEQLGHAHRGEKVAVLCPANDVVHYAATLFGHGRRPGAGFASPAAHSCCHLVLSRQGTTLADYNLSLR